MMPDNGHADDFCWDTLDPRAFHPVRVEIVEALCWIGHPLAAVDLVRVFEERHLELRVEYHLRRLCKLGGVKPGCGDDNDEVPCPMGQRPYRPVGQPTP